MQFLRFIGRWPDAKASWFLLFLSALGLNLSALYFQYGLGLEPCIMCIYQRTAVYGVLLAALLPLLFNIAPVRVLAYVLWGYAAIEGLLVAIEHVDIQQAENSFFAFCEIVPNFPEWAPLHEWLPGLFAATGDCGDINWQFMDMSMPQWMIVVFSIYTAIFALVLMCRLFIVRKI